MAAPTRQAVVAVFGGNDVDPAVLEAARQSGAAIVRAGAVLLTGGVGTGADEVKEQAIVGAGAERWIGVENSHLPAPPRHVHGGVVLSPGVGHRRNFVGAALCDAAIALRGDDGTASEVLFALALGRPVALYGWSPEGDLASAARRRVPPRRGDRVLDRAIAAAYDRAVAMPAPVAAEVPADVVVARLLRGTVEPVDPDALLALHDRKSWDELLAARVGSG